MYQLANVGNCVEFNGFSQVVESKEECESAAGSLGLSSTTATVLETSPINPRGCYWMQSSSQLYFNNGGSWYETSTDRRSICTNAGKSFRLHLNS